MIKQKLASWQDEFAALRQDIHRHPELAFEENRTSALVCEKLKSWGFEVTQGLGGTGVIGTLRRGAGRSIGLRADMDALPIQEASGKPWASTIPGKMHACGHDGHTTTLLAAARYLAEAGNFSGTVHLIFQPAEENIGGAERMIEEGLFAKFPCDAIFALHNLPRLAEGEILIKSGPIMAAVDVATIIIKGLGGHGAAPHLTRDPILAASAIVMGLQSLVSRNLKATDAGVVTIGAFQAGSISTVIPETATLQASLRSTSREGRALLERRFHEMIRATAQAYGCEAEIDYERSYPATFNSQAETEFVMGVLGASGFSIQETDEPMMFSEDFAYMLEKVPGCYFMLGASEDPNMPFLHDAAYDFNDRLIVPGALAFVQLVEAYLKP